MVPMRVGHQDAEQPVVVVAAGVELLTDGPQYLVGRAHEPRKHRDVLSNAGPKTRVDQQIPFRMSNEHGCCGEVALVAKRSWTPSSELTTVTERRPRTDQWRTLA